MTEIRKAFPSLEVIASRRQLSPTIESLRRIHVVEYSSKAHPAQIARDFESLPEVIYAEPVFRYRTFGVRIMPNDPLYASQQYLDRLRFPEAWDLVKGSDSTVVIAIVDGGTTWRHTDLRANIWTNPGEIAGNGLDDDANGFVDDVHGWNFELGSPNPSEGSEYAVEHGTTVAGVAAAVTDNDEGIAGAGWNAQFIPVKIVFSCRDIHKCYDSSAQGIVYAAMNGADVITASFGGDGNSETLRLAVKAALSEGTLVVSAAGNKGIDVDIHPGYPCSYSQTLCVGGTEPDSDANVFNYGRTVDVFAPSKSIRVTRPGNTYGHSRGTSYAVPIVAGLAALVKTAYPHFGPDQVREQIRLTATNIDAANPGLEGKMGRGRVDALSAVTAAPLPAIRVTSWTYHDEHGSQYIEIGDLTTITATFTNHHGDASAAEVVLSADGDYVQWQTQRVDLGSMAHGESRDATFQFTPTAGTRDNVVRLIPTVTVGSLVDSPDQLQFELTVPIAEADSLALVALYHSMGGPNWTDRDNWLVAGQPVSEWFGTVLDQDRVVELDLSRNNLSGTLPPELGQLTELKRLQLSQNNTGGPIPRELGQLTALTFLDLSNNVLTGEIVEELGQLSELRELGLSSNHLSGPIPPALAQLTKLEALRLLVNQLSGPIPPELSQLKQLRVLSLAANQLSGPIPPELGQLTALSQLDLKNNRFDGPIPPQLSQLANIYWFGLNDNQLTGPVPPELAQMKTVGVIFLQNNRLTGELPLGFTSLTNVYQLQFSQRGGTQNALCAPLDTQFQTWLQNITFVGGPNCLPNTATDEVDVLPTKFELHGNYPNPFNMSTSVLFDLPHPATVTIEVFDLLGRKVLTRAPQEVSPGWSRAVTLDTTPLSSGNYLYRLIVVGGDDSKQHSGFLTLVR